ncbi:MAG TPA: DUF2911 domain-containing protein [Thermoanaerobaculia bacterium]|jgi:hypothetical protein|nr:DUF2911 domain-containing protein [Thermoanaerobaculia bacterium]
MRRTLCTTLVLSLAAGMALAADNRPLSPAGEASAQVLGKWVASDKPTYALGNKRYEGGKWIDITFGRPLRRGRDLWGSGASYGKDALLDAPIWRAGANVSTRLKTEVPLVIAGKTVAPGEYSLFIDLKENSWTLVVSSWPAQQHYDPNDKAALWGSYGYTPDKDVVRAKMKLETLPHSVEQLTWSFVDMTDQSGALAISWGNTMASVPFQAAAAPAAGGGS